MNKQPTNTILMHPSKAEASRERVLDAAAKLFHDSGFAATTMRDVAEAAEMKAGSLYYHYKSKQSLLEAVLDKSIAEVSAAVSPFLVCGPNQLSYRDRVGQAIRAHLQATMFLGDYAAASRRLLAEAPPAVRERHKRARQRLDAKWRKLLEEARTAGEIRGDLNLSLVRLFLVGAANFAHEWYKPEGGSLDDVAETLTELLFAGLSPRAEQDLAPPRSLGAGRSQGGVLP
jgi:AcrR family transcriptional regulator